MSAPASAPAAAAASSSATGTHANEPEGDCVLAIVDSLNRQLARWLNQHNGRARTCAAATELAFDADVSGLSKAERARLRRLLAAQGFSVMAGVMTYAGSGDEQELFAIYRTIPAAAPASASAPTPAPDTSRSEEGKEGEGEQPQQHVDCDECEAPVTPDFVKLPRCEHVFCSTCAASMLASPDCDCCAACVACYAPFRFEDMRHLDGRPFDVDADQPPPPPSKRQRTDAAAAAARE